MKFKLAPLDLRRDIAAWAPYSKSSLAKRTQTSCLTSDQPTHLVIETYRWHTATYVECKNAITSAEGCSPRNVPLMTNMLAPPEIGFYLCVVGCAAIIPISNEIIREFRYAKQIL